METQSARPAIQPARLAPRMKSASWFMTSRSRSLVFTAWCPFSG
nr:MAG TPA: hypothetical protein [Caudoviricetes sp.]